MEEGDEKYICPQCEEECWESEFVPDDYAQYNGFADEYFCPNCNAVVD